MVGSHVWVEDPEVAWLDGVVVEINGEEITVDCNSEKTVSFTLVYALIGLLLFIIQCTFSLAFKL